MQYEKRMTQSNRYLRLLSDTGVFVIGNFLAKLIQYFLLPLYTSAMTTEAYGTAELLNNLSEMLFPIVTLALYEAVFRFAVDQNQDLDALLYESTSLLCKIFLGIFSFVLVFQRFVGYTYTYELLFVLVSYSFRMLFANYARGGGYTKCFSLSGVVNALALAIFSWIFLVCVHYGARGYLLALGCAHISSLVVLFVGAGIPRRLLLHKRNRRLLVAMLYFSAPLILNNIAWWVTSMSGRYVILLTYGAGLAGLYAAANKLPAVISVVSQVFQQAWQLNSAREYQSRNHEVFFENVWRIYSTAIFLFGAIAISSTPILAHMTLRNEFFEARHYIPPMMLAVIISCLSAYFGSLLIAYKMTKVAMKGMLLGATINMLLAIILIDPLGIWGVLTASVVCYLTILIHRAVSVQRKFPVNLHLRQTISLFLLLLIETVLMCFDISLCQWISWGICLLMFGLCFIALRDIRNTLIGKAKQYFSQKTD
ncbi:MAG: lipopolysaccharide biosynthesis protein [Clostridia bacterium]|nr:lipopolysaccharide biosynthesis protein [Clostridia bacterium]